MRNNQKTLKAEKYRCVQDAIESDEPVLPGRITILPSTLYGSPRWYARQFQDAMAIVREKGKPDLFITFTCNPKWKEIQESLLPGQQPQDRPDIVARVFYMKWEALLHDILKKDILGHVDGYVSVKETQKRHLPHVHALFTLVAADKPRVPADIDRIVSAEIPDATTNPELHRVVTSHMIHEPCGAPNMTARCMDKGKCKKDFPKPFRSATAMSDRSYPLYRRRQETDGAPGCSFPRPGHGVPVTITNQWVVPFNPYLCLRYESHINVEIVCSVTSVKYLYKYLDKGPDRCMMYVGGPEQDIRHDEIQRYEVGRYISVSEAFWRLYDFPIQKKYPPVEQLAIHLEGEQVITFNNDGEAHALIESGPPRTTLTAFFTAMQRNVDKRHITYPEVFKHFSFDCRNKTFKLRKKRLSRGHDDEQLADTIGRIPVLAFTPHNAELYFMRMLLYRVPGPTCYNDLRFVDGLLHDTYMAACIARGICENDNEVDMVMEEAASVTFGSNLRELFANLLMFVLKKDYFQFWQRHMHTISEDLTHAAGLSEPDDTVINQVLLELQDYVERHGYHLTNNFQLPQPNLALIQPRIPQDIRHETEHNMTELQNVIQETQHLLNDEQRAVADCVLESVRLNLGQLIGLDASGGTGKTFTLTFILTSVRAGGKVALATASSGIAATLLPKGTTFHSRTKCPIMLTEESMCAISENDSTAQLIRMCSLLVIDEVSMMDRRAVEAADRTFQWLRKSDSPFGGITTIFSGDWRQILPVVRHGTRPQIISRCLKSSDLWKNVKTMQLTTNMRIARAGAEMADEALFCQFLLDLGEGKIPTVQEQGEFAITVPERFLMPGKTLQELVDWVFEDLDQHMHDHRWLYERAILCPTNAEVDNVNQYISSKFPGEEHILLSVDSVEPEQSHEYPVEFLNTLCPSGMPPHRLPLKVGMIIMLLRNLDQVNGHCNGSRYILKQVFPHVLEAELVSGVHAGTQLYIPRIRISPSENIFPFTLSRKQFPVRPCFAMTVNKAQGQSLSRVGMFTVKDFFSHGQFYVAASRVGHPSQLRILPINDEDNSKRTVMNNVVYKEILTHAGTLKCQFLNG